MTARRGEPPVHPLRPRDDNDPPPPRREQLPLPRRSRQDHLEPQLRVPGGTGEGTPFAPFAAADPEPAPVRSAHGDAPAAFRAGTQVGRADRADGPAQAEDVRDDR